MVDCADENCHAVYMTRIQKIEEAQQLLDAALDYLTKAESALFEVDVQTSSELWMREDMEKSVAVLNRIESALYCHDEQGEILYSRPF